VGLFAATSQDPVPVIGVVAGFAALVGVLVRSLLQQGAGWRQIIATKNDEHDSLRRDMAAQEIRCRAEIAALAGDLATARAQVETLQMQVRELQRNDDRRRDVP
jgi:multidrug resistance efflux pump